MPPQRLHIVSLVKQVPNTRDVTADAMKEDGTVNRAALPAIFNPEDMNALELALQLKACYAGRLTVLSMGPPRAAECLRDALFRGADDVVLVSDPKFAGADTLATSYTLARAVRKLGDVKIVCCGRQAIDGDTAQVGPQLAEKLGWPQATYVHTFDYLDEQGGGRLIVRKEVDGGFEQLMLPIPVLLTVTSTANEPRPPSAKRLLRYKRARCAAELRAELKGRSEDEIAARLAALEADGLLIPTWGVDDLDVEPERIGLAGSPTKVKGIETVVLTGGDCKWIDATPEGVGELVRELITEHTLG